MFSYNVTSTPEMKERLMKFLSLNDYQYQDIFIGNTDGKTNFILLVDDQLPKFIPLEDLITFSLIKTFGISSSAPLSQVKEEVVYSGRMEIKEEKEEEMPQMEMTKLSLETRNKDTINREFTVMYKGKQRHIYVHNPCLESGFEHLVQVDDLDAKGNSIRTYNIVQLKKENPTIKFPF
jgi:hypothetical protein